MCNHCAYLVWTFPITHHQEPHLECLRPEGHRGEHVVQNARGRFYAWDADLGCDCEETGCDCIVFGEISPAEAANMIADTEWSDGASASLPAT